MDTTKLDSKKLLLNEARALGHAEVRTKPKHVSERRAAVLESITDLRREEERRVHARARTR